MAFLLQWIFLFEFLNEIVDKENMELTRGKRRKDAYRKNTGTSSGLNILILKSVIQDNFKGSKGERSTSSFHSVPICRSHCFERKKNQGTKNEGTGTCCIILDFIVEMSSANCNLLSSLLVLICFFF